MNKKELDLLLSKYYRGETSLDEEQQLRQAMLEGDDADALLQQALDKVDSEIEVPGDLESSLSDMIDQWDSAEQHEAAVAPSMWRRNTWWAAAASVAVIAAVGFWFMRNTSQPVAEQEHPVIAQVKKEPVPSQPAATQPLPVEKANTHAGQPQPVPKPVPQPEPVAKVKSVNSHNNSDAMLAKAASPATSKGKNQASEETLLSPEEELLAMAALEKFSSTLNKGMDQLNDAGEKIENINNTIKQLL